MHGKVQDSLRATNALLTGFDRTRKHTKITFLCTSNMLGCLDSAFIDRCGIKLEVDLPRPAVEHEIPRGRIQSLIDNRYVYHEDPAPTIPRCETRVRHGQKVAWK